jgi:hypothetical protein
VVIGSPTSHVFLMPVFTELIGVQHVLHNE